MTRWTKGPRLALHTEISHCKFGENQLSRRCLRSLRYCKVSNIQHLQYTGNLTSSPKGLFMECVWWALGQHGKLSSSSVEQTGHVCDNAQMDLCFPRSIKVFIACAVKLIIRYREHLVFGSNSPVNTNCSGFGICIQIGLNDSLIYNKMRT